MNNQQPDTVGGEQTNPCEKSIKIWGTKLRAKLSCQASLADIKLVRSDIDRFADNFDALIQYLKSNKDKLVQDEEISDELKVWLEQDGLEQLNTEKLKTIFLRVAEDHNALIRSECAISSASAHKQIIGEQGEGIHSIPDEVEPEKLTFGFIRTAQPNNKADAHSSKSMGLTFPFVSLPDQITMVDDITTDHPMVSTLQKIYTQTNHGWLNHLTISALSPELCDYSNKDEDIAAWAQKHFADRASCYPTMEFGCENSLYEGWAVYTAAQVMSASPEGKVIKSKVLETAMEMISHCKDYIGKNDDSEKAKNTAYWFLLQTTKALRNIIPVDGFEMRKFIEAAVSHVPHAERNAVFNAEYMKARLYQDNKALCLLQSPHMADHDPENQAKYQRFNKDNAKITAEAIALLDRKYG